MKTAILIFVGLLILTGCSLTEAFSKKKIISFNCDDFYPVCGEDEVTYYNQCQAEEKEVEIAYDGACNGTDIETIPYDRITVEE